MIKTTIYTTPSCSYCHLTKRFFNDNKVEYKEIDVAVDEEAAHEMVHRSGQMGVPVIAIEKDGQEHIVVGYQPEVLAKHLGIT